jgi:hypothetical protein
VCEYIGMEDDERLEVYSVDSEIRYDRADQEIPERTKKSVRDRECIPNMITIGKGVIAGLKYQADWKKRTFMQLLNF